MYIFTVSFTRPYTEFLFSFPPNIPKEDMNYITMVYLGSLGIFSILMTVV